LGLATWAEVAYICGFLKRLRAKRQSSGAGFLRDVEMGRFKTVVSGLILFAAGYVTATLNGFAPVQIQATTQDPPDQVSQDAMKAYKKVSKAIKELNNLYVASGESTSAFDGVNFFAASVGGINAERDLEEGRGVDPETFAAIYAGKASPKIKENLDVDELGRLRYKKNVIRLYSQERLQLMFKQRDQLEIRSESVD
jgi:hypothetical protein